MLGHCKSDRVLPIDRKPVQETLYWKRATGEMTEAEFKAAFSKWQRGEEGGVAHA